MPSLRLRRSGRSASHRPAAWLSRSDGHTLVELLVAMTLSAIALAVVTRDFSFSVRNRDDMDLIAETQHAARSSLTFLTQELRQAGACMPSLGDFIALDGKNKGNRDRLTLRIGIADHDTLQCARTILNRRAVRDATSIRVESVEGFAVGQWIYIIKSTGHGSFFKVTQVAAPWIELDGALDRNYPRNSGVYAIEERTYEVQDVDGFSTLMVSIDGEVPQPMVRGIESLDVQYRMAPCPPCDPVDLPSTDALWRVVREVDIRVTARSTRPGVDGEYAVLEEAATVKPRNLL